MELHLAERSNTEIESLLSGPAASPAALALLDRAWEFAKKAHAGQQRRSGEPHTEHLFQTAKNLSELNMGVTVIAAGILHDTIEDTEVTYQQLEEVFSTEIAFLVDGVTKLKKQHLPQKERQVQSLRKMLLATVRDPRVVVIKLCDRLHNMQTLQYMPQQKRKNIALETLEIYAPVAERLSIGSVRRKLEDLAFPYALPVEYKETKDLFDKILPGHLMAATKIKETIIAEQQRELMEIHVRIKGLYSFFRKLERKNHELSLIQDIASVQIIVPSVDSCYMMLGAVHAAGRPCPGSMKDFISFPRPNGYRSLRTTIQQEEFPIEIQIFTPEFYHQALFGNASELSRKNIEKRSWVQGLFAALFKHENSIRS